MTVDTASDRRSDLQDFDPTRILIDGNWRTADGSESFSSVSPATGETLARLPVSGRAELADAIIAATRAFEELCATDADAIAGFLEDLGSLIEANADVLTRTAAAETGLSVEPRLLGVELPRTVDQLRQAARAARRRSWRLPQLCPAERIAAYRTPLPGPVLVLGPNNFPLAFNPVAGGDFAAAVATHHPVIAISNPGHPRTTALLAELGRQAAHRSGLPSAIVQLLHAVPPELGLELAADRRLAAVAYTGSRTAGLALKAAADGAGVPMYAELSAVNPVVVLPEAAHERGREIAAQLATSVLGSGGQLCTKPGVILVPDDKGEQLTLGLAHALTNSDPVVVLSPRVAQELDALADLWTTAGARTLAGSEPPPTEAGNRVRPRLFEVSAADFLDQPELFGTEAFGPMALVVRWNGRDQLVRTVNALEPSLTGTVFTAASGRDEDIYDPVRSALAPRVGRLLDNKVPTGVAVVPAMHHGGPFPSSSHPAFTSVGIPESLLRFAGRLSFDNVSDAHLPPELQSSNPLKLIREVDGSPTTEPIVWGNS